MPSDNASGRSKFTPWLVGLLAVTGAALIGFRRPADVSQPAKGPAEPARDEKKAEPLAEENISGPLDVLRDHLRVAADKFEKTSTLSLQFKRAAAGSSLSLSLDGNWLTHESQRSLSYYLKQDPARYEFLIATVPDPVETKFANEFDAVLGGIQRAFEARNFSIRASWLPWSRRKDKGGTDAPSKSVRSHREYPGILLFRKIRKSGVRKDLASIALVYVVGESPISGIHKTALTRALLDRQYLDKEISQAAKDCHDVSWANDNDNNICIISPFFSGSQASLGLTLQQWKRNRFKTNLKVISGSASALNPRLFVSYGLPCPQSTVIPNDLVTQGVLRYLAGNPNTELDRPEDKIPYRVAMLREADTGFGIRVDPANQNKKNRNGRAFNDFVAEKPIDLPFPISVSQLQVEQERLGKSGVVLPHTEFVEPKLPVRDQTQLDAIPPYDPESAGSTAGQSLRMIMTTINREHVRYVGIVATDTRDVVFLNRLLRKECPNVRVFTTEPGIALTHPEEADHLRGMLVGSTYPLALVTQSWGRTKGSPSRMIWFPTQASQGYYNAVLIHFDLPNRMLGYHPPPFPDGKRDFDRPAIWISVVGEGGRLVPVHCYTSYETGDQEGRHPKLCPPSSCPTDRLPIPAVPVGVLLGSLGAVAALAAVIFALSGREVIWQKIAFGLAKNEAEAGSCQETVWVWVWRAVMLVGVLLFALPYTLPVRELWDPYCADLGEEAGWRQLFVVGAAGVLTAQIMAILVLLVLRGCRILPARSGEKSQWAYFVLVIVVLAGVAAVAWWSVPKSSVARFFLYVRATELTAGLSPLIPMGLLGGAVLILGYCGLRQADLARAVKLDCPYPDSWTAISEANGSLKAELENPFRLFLINKKTWGFLLVLGVVLLCAFWDSVVIALPSEEGRFWDNLMRATFWVIVLAVVFTLARFLVLWSRLRDLLKEIHRLPMVRAFERLPDEVRRLFGGYFYTWERVRHPHLAVLLWTLPQEERAELGVQLGGESPALAATFPKAGAASIPPSAVPCGLAGELRKKAREYLEELPPTWAAKTVEEAFGGTNDALAESKDEDRETNGGVKTTLALTHPGRQLVADMEGFAAAFVVSYLGQYFAQLRMLLYALAAAPLLLFAAASYTFQPERWNLNVLVGLLAAIAIGTVFVLYQINKDGLVSRISQTTPNRFTPDTGFFSSLITYVLPILTILLLHVLGVFRFITEPILALFQ
jgi:hypothetical protein